MPDYEKVEDLARSQIGFREGYSDGHWNNIEPFAAQVPGLAWANGQPWCAVYVCWAFFRAFLAAAAAVLAGFPTAAVRTLYDAAVAAGRFTEWPTRGAAVIYGRNADSHTGICVGWDDRFAYVVEGNTNDDGSSEGNGVYLKTRLRRDSYLKGYSVPIFPDGIVSSLDPAFDTGDPVTPPPAPAAPASGDTRPHVWIRHLLASINIDSPAPDGAPPANGPNTMPVEQALVAEGLLDPRYADGSAGTATFGPGSAYQAWQVRCGFRGHDADGYPGLDSLTRLGAAHGFVVVNDLMGVAA